MVILLTPDLQKLCIKCLINAHRQSFRAFEITLQVGAPCSVHIVVTLIPQPKQSLLLLLLLLQLERRSILCLISKDGIERQIGIMNAHRPHRLLYWGIHLLEAQGNGAAICIPAQAFL